MSGIRRIVLLVSVIVFGACGGSGEGSVEGASTSAGVTSEAPTTEPTTAPTSTSPPTTAKAPTTTEAAGLGSGTFTMGGITVDFIVTSCGDRPDSETMTYDMVGEGDGGLLVRASQQIRDDGGTQQNLDVFIGDGGYLRAVRVERDGQWTENFGLVNVDGPLFDETTTGSVTATAVFELVSDFAPTDSGFTTALVGEGTIQAECT